MDTFRTVIKPSPASFNISHTDPLLFIGSCFTEHIGSKMELLKFPVCINPSGILYNPISIANTINRLVTVKQYSQEDLVLHNGIWHSFDHHGSFSGTDKDEVLFRINESLNKGADFLRKASFLFITLGNAHIYRYQKTGQIAANCHKIPDAEFAFSMLAPEQIAENLTRVWKLVHEVNPSLRIIFSISPVRYLRYGHTGNQAGKSVLFVAVHRLLKEIPGSVYFPAYEIMMDDLRDYRFYEPDMIHPNTVAIEYIWNFFCQTYFTDATLQIIRKLEIIQRALEHRPIRPNTEEHSRFIEQIRTYISEMEKQYAFLNFQEEKERLRTFSDPGKTV